MLKDRFPDLFGHRETPRCADAAATLSHLIRPSMGTAQSESSRARAGAAMLREFDRATAPARDVHPISPAEAPLPDVVVVGGVQLAHVEDRADSAADADAVLSIVARHLHRSEW